MLIRCRGYIVCRHLLDSILISLSLSLLICRHILIFLCLKISSCSNLCCVLGSCCDKLCCSSNRKWHFLLHCPLWSDKIRDFCSIFPSGTRSFLCALNFAIVSLLRFTSYQDLKSSFETGSLISHDLKFWFNIFICFPSTFICDDLDDKSSSRQFLISTARIISFTLSFKPNFGAPCSDSQWKLTARQILGYTLINKIKIARPPPHIHYKTSKSNKNTARYKQFHTQWVPSFVFLCEEIPLISCLISKLAITSLVNLVVISNFRGDNFRKRTMSRFSSAQSCPPLSSLSSRSFDVKIGIVFYELPLQSEVLWWTVLSVNIPYYTSDFQKDPGSRTTGPPPLETDSFHNLSLPSLPTTRVPGTALCFHYSEFKWVHHADNAAVQAAHIYGRFLERRPSCHISRPDSLIVLDMIYLSADCAKWCIGRC